MKTSQNLADIETNIESLQASLRELGENAALFLELDNEGMISWQIGLHEERLVALTRQRDCLGRLSLVH